VRWRESITWMTEEGVTDIAELGHGKVLTVMLRRIVKGINGLAVGTPEQLEAFATALKG